MPTYAIEREGRDKPRVVDAANPAAARQHVARDELKVRKIETREAFALAAQGIKLETAGYGEAEVVEAEEVNNG